MQKITLQIPMNAKLKMAAEKAASEQGFSSLQEVLRVFMKKFASKKINFSFEGEDVIYLSPSADKRYAKITRDIESGKEKIYAAKDIDDLMRQLLSK